MIIARGHSLLLLQLLLLTCYWPSMSQIVHALAVARFYVCKPGENRWRYTDMKGCVAIVSESNLEMVCAHYVRLIDMEAFNPVCCTRPRRPSPLTRFAPI